MSVQHLMVRTNLLFSLSYMAFAAFSTIVFHFHSVRLKPFAFRTFFGHFVYVFSQFFIKFNHSLITAVTFFFHGKKMSSISIGLYRSVCYDLTIFTQSTTVKFICGYIFLLRAARNILHKKRMKIVSHWC